MEILVIYKWTTHYVSDATQVANTGTGTATTGTIDLSNYDDYKNISIDDIDIGVTNIYAVNVHIGSITLSKTSYDNTTGILTFSYKYTALNSTEGRSVEVWVKAFV